MASFLVALAVSLVISIVAALLAPKPKQPKDNSAQELDDPTADAGRPLPVVFGTVTVKSPNILWFGQKSMHEYEVKV
tara:strand:+ start:623 stop:853 length:231 start_codon:yes stop_codon:yes gene_type:complete